LRKLSINIDNFVIPSICDFFNVKEVSTLARNSVTTVEITGLQGDLIFSLSRGNYIKIDDNTDRTSIRVCSGVIEEIRTTTTKIKITTALRIRNSSWKRMEGKKFAGFLDGELFSIMNSLVSDLGITAIKEYEGSIPIREYKDDFVDEIVRSILDSTGIPWNIQREKLFLGNVGSGYNNSMKLISRHNGILKDDYGIIDIVCAELANVGLLYPGDVIDINRANYIVVRIDREVKKEYGANFSTLNVICCQGTSDAMRASIYYDDEEEIRQVAYSIKEPIRVNHKLRRLEFVWGGNEWVGELVNYTFEGTSMLPGAYLKIGGIACSATVGYHIGKDTKIVGMNISLVKTIVPTYEDGYIEICRNGVAIGNVKFKEVGLSKDLDINFAGGGVLSLRNKSDLNFPTLNSVIVEIRARELKNE